MASTLPHSREQRFRFIEALALWEGAVQRKQISDAFGVAPNHVTNDLRIYDKSHPKNIQFDPRKRAYIPKETFKPAYISTDPSEYLSLLYAHTESKSEAALANIGGQRISSEIIPNPSHGLKTNTVQRIIKAIRSEVGVEVTYNSMSSPNPTKRIIWPHSFFHTGFRWQVRAYDDHRNEFRDFVIQRVSTIRPCEKHAPVSKDEDYEWNTYITVELAPNPNLSDHQKKIVASDYDMSRKKEDYIWSLELRKCLFPYFAVRYNISRENNHTPINQYPVVLKNYEHLKDLFF